MTETTLPRTPRTDEAELSLLDIQSGHGPSPYVPAELARQLEGELYAALVCAGVASLERGEWAGEREDLIEAAALECDHEADRQSLYASEAGTPGLRLIHGTAANTLMSVACRIRARKSATALNAPRISAVTAERDELARRIGDVSARLAAMTIERDSLRTAFENEKATSVHLEELVESERAEKNALMDDLRKCENLLIEATKVE